MCLPVPFVLSSPLPTTAVTTTGCRRIGVKESDLSQDHFKKMIRKSVRFQENVYVFTDYNKYNKKFFLHNDSMTSLSSLTVVSDSSDSDSSFSDINEISQSSDSVDDYSSSWYSKSQMDSFRREVCVSKRVVRNYCKNNAAIAPATTIDCDSDDCCTIDKTSSSASQKRKVKCQPILALNDVTRGLEQHCCKERYRRKVIGNKFIVHISKKLFPLSNVNNAIKLANVAQKCNTWASVLALEEGSRDYIRAYNNNHGDFTTGTTSSPITHDFHLPSRTVDVVSPLTDENELVEQEQEQHQQLIHKRQRLCEY